jgi:hypothetical protein
MLSASSVAFAVLGSGVRAQNEALHGSTKYPDGTGSVSLPDFKDWQAQNRFFQGIAAYRAADFDPKGKESSERISGALVTPNFFDVMGVQPFRNFWSRQERTVTLDCHVKLSPNLVASSTCVSLMVGL